jgi:hypothetical protein
MWCSGQFTVISEPFIDVYKSSLVSGEECIMAGAKLRSICETLLCQSRVKPIFVKDMAYHANPFLSDTFIQSVNNTFMIRDPKLSIPSLYKMRANYAERETGFEGQFELFQRIQNITGNAPFVIDGEQLKNTAESIVRDYFRYIGHEMPADILIWPAGSRDDWVGRESWHLEAINSNGFKPATSSVDFDRLPPKVLDSIERNMPYYQEMYKQISIKNADSNGIK